jgi:hypothetical protein
MTANVERGRDILVVAHVAPEGEAPLARWSGEPMFAPAARHIAEGVKGLRHVPYAADIHRDRLIRDRNLDAEHAQELLDEVVGLFPHGEMGGLLEGDEALVGGGEGVVVAACQLPRGVEVVAALEDVDRYLEARGEGEEV